MARTLLVVGDDKTGRRLLAHLGPSPDLAVVLDHSATPGRVWRLLRRGALPWPLLARMALAEWLRQDWPRPDLPAVAASRDLVRAARDCGAERILLFRAGIIIDAEGLAAGIPFLNVHCASLDGFGGLGAIARALAAGALEQQATLHRVTARIDQGEILDREPYRLDPALGYRASEDLAYDAGIRLVLRTLGQPSS